MSKTSERRIFVDLEHTGGKGRYILDLAIVSEDGEILFNSLIRPPSRVYGNSEEMNQWRISSKYSHGIEPSDVATAPLLDDVLAELVPIFDGAIMIAHNISCELSVLPSLLVVKLAGSGCTHKTFKQSFKDAASTKLGSALSYAGIDLKNAHQALSDAVGCCRLAAWMESRGVLIPVSKAETVAQRHEREVVQRAKMCPREFKGLSPVGYPEIADGLRAELSRLNEAQRNAGVKFFNAGHSWDSDQELQLKTMVDQGDDLLEISKLLGRSPLSIALVVARLFHVEQARRLVLAQAIPA